MLNRRLLIASLGASAILGLAPAVALKAAGITVHPLPDLYLDCCLDCADHPVEMWMSPAMFNSIKGFKVPLDTPNGMDLGTYQDVPVRAMLNPNSLDHDWLMIYSTPKPGVIHWQTYQDGVLHSVGGNESGAPIRGHDCIGKVFRN